MVNNLDWTAPMSAIDLLRDVGKHFRVNRMLAKEAVSARLESDAGISYTEFSYQILQAMDFLELYRRYGCTLQTGGSDQWGNLTAGWTSSAGSSGVSAHALATPLVTKADGTKFGKTEGGTVWLDPALTSPYAFYQFWVNTDDRDVAAPACACSACGRGRRSRRSRRRRAERPAAREAQRALADELTTPRPRAEAGARRPSTPAGPCSARAPLDDAGRGDARRPRCARPRRRRRGPPARRVIDLLVGHRPRGLALGGAPGRRGGRRLREQRPGAGRRRRRRRPDFLHGRWLVLRRGKRSVGRRANGPRCG